MDSQNPPLAIPERPKACYHEQLPETHCWDNRDRDIKKDRCQCALGKASSSKPAQGSKQKRKYAELCGDSFQDADKVQTLKQARVMCERMPTKAAHTVRSAEMFSNARDFMITGGNFLIQQISGQESGQGIVPGIRVVVYLLNGGLYAQIAFEDISINRELHRNQKYRLHSDNSSGRERVVKVYQGPRAKERAREAARFYKKVFHPTFLHIVGVSPLNCEVPFLVFNGGFQGSLEIGIAKALEKDLRKSVTLGLQTVIGLSSGLDYLRDVGYPFITARSQNFYPFLSQEGEVIISFDPDMVHEPGDENLHNEQSCFGDRPLLIFHELCGQTFDTACQSHYERQQVKRTYGDTSETEEVFPFSVASTSTTSSADVSSENPLGKPTIDKHRRELVWNRENQENSSLEDIYLKFKTFFNGLPASSEPALHHRRGRSTARTVHRCPGYNRTEITLTPSITRSAIVSHSTPLPHEICLVCHRVVKDVEIFNCICGGEDDESIPTIQCLKCCEWHHRLCVVGIESTERSFTCPNCHQSHPNGNSFLSLSMHEVPMINYPCTVCCRPTSMWCSRCQSAWYCSPEHNYNDWPRHRNECVPAMKAAN